MANINISPIFFSAIILIRKLRELSRLKKSCEKVNLNRLKMRRKSSALIKKTCAIYTAPNVFHMVWIRISRSIIPNIKIREPISLRIRSDPDPNRQKHWILSKKTQSFTFPMKFIWILDYPQIARIGSDTGSGYKNLNYGSGFRSPIKYRFGRTRNAGSENERTSCPKLSVR